MMPAWRALKEMHCIALIDKPPLYLADSAPKNIKTARKIHTRAPLTYVIFSSV
jgi:hypothetical protein